jgi:copper/silver-translocating P-type ATPase
MTACVHCDEVVIKGFFNEDDTLKEHPFCCYGCLTVHNVLHAKGLDSYYEIKKNSGLYKRRSPVELKKIEYAFLDDPEFLEQYTYEGGSGGRTMEFYLEGIHCLACLWLIEKLPEFLSSVLVSKLDLERSVATVEVQHGGKFSEVARELNNLGYRPHPLKKNQDAADLKIKEERSALIRIGVAGAAAGNIMIYAVSLYGGASHEFAELFNFLTVLFAIPVLTYSAYPFYQTAWNAIKNRTLSIDIPISLALIMGAVMGLYNLFEGVTENYFDSLTTLVFLLLLSRYFLQKIQEKGLSAQDLHFFYQSESVLKRDENNLESFKEIHPKFVKNNDVLKIRSGEFIPVDGVVLDGSSNLNNSLLTGESLPVKVKIGDKVFSGTQNLNSDLLIKTEKVQDETRLGSILKNVENGWSHRSKMVDLTSKVSKYFTLVVFALSVILYLYLFQKGDSKFAFEQAMTLLIVTCPCALALAVPLTFTRALSKASEHGIIIKNDEVIEKLAKIKHIFLDKTGTVTHGRLQIENFRVLLPSHIAVEDVIASLEQESAHPVAKALMEFAQEKKAKIHSVSDYQEIIGKGVEGRIEQHFYEINRDGIFENQNLIATFKVKDLLRSDARSVLAHLRSLNLDIKMISGDHQSVVNDIAHEVGLIKTEALAELTPEQKGELIKMTPHSMMVGDGANDAVALSNAEVGVAVLGAMDISLRAADVYLTVPGLVMVEKLIHHSRETMRVIHRNLILSLIYNSISVVAVFTGIINPLVAAIIMPVSSLTVLFSTLAGTKKLRDLWKS